MRKRLHSETADCIRIRKFQQNVTEEWNVTSALTKALIIMPVSMIDKIKTGGYGIAIIIILCLLGDLNKTEHENNVVTWERRDKRNKNHMYIYA